MWKMKEKEKDIQSTHKIWWDGACRDYWWSGYLWSFCDKIKNNNKQRKLLVVIQVQQEERMKIQMTWLLVLTTQTPRTAYSLFLPLYSFYSSLRFWSPTTTNRKKKKEETMQKWVEKGVRVGERMMKDGRMYPVVAGLLLLVELFFNTAIVSFVPCMFHLFFFFIVPKLNSILIFS